MNLHAWLLANNSTDAALLANRALGIAIWVGVAILTVALLILMRTRWGQVQPLSKCVVLSVFAHILLFSVRLRNAPAGSRHAGRR